MLITFIRNYLEKTSEERKNAIEFIRKNKLLDKIGEQMKCTFQPNMRRLSSENYRSNSKITGSFYER